MSKPSILQIFLIACVIFLSGCGDIQNKKPNFVFILVDDLGWTDLACYGSDFHETPNIDRLASESMLFTNAYAACPVCSPTRAAIMTGKYPSRVNITDWIPGDDPKNRELTGTIDQNELTLEEITLAEALKQNGYKTFFAGKWHLGDEGFFPEDQGFDVNIGGHHRGSPPGGYYTPYKNPKLSDGPDGEYLTDRLTDESIRFMKENKDRPFLLYLSFYTVHTPIQANNEYAGHYREKLHELGEPDVERMPEHMAFTTQQQLNADYASMVHALDVNIGRLLGTIEDLGISDNTVIIFTSDNGGLSTITNPNWTAPTSVKPLRAGKGWCYEGGIRVPLIIKTPEMNMSTVCDKPVISMDFYPTILELAGIVPMPDQHMDGANLSPLLHGTKEFEREDIFWHYPHYHSSGWTPGAAIRSGKWKLIEFYELNKTELYDLENDPGENNDLAEVYPEKVKEIHEKLSLLQKNTGALFPTRNPNNQ
ncbi:MAG: sulfatase [Bacteroidales bacterium]|nr:sulfatase [Bacteroidales bacterium]